MKSKPHSIAYLPLIIVVAIGLLFAWIIYSQSFSSLGTDTQKYSKSLDSIPYTSQDLNISFNYPKDWHIDDRDMNLLLTNYPSSLNKDLKPTDNQLELFMSSFSGCHPTVEENLKDPGCGEGGPSVKPNEIISKDYRQTAGGIFYKYTVKTPNTQLTFYLLQNGDRVLQLSKQPDPSEFETEFDQIVDSIKFLN